MKKIIILSILVLVFFNFQLVYCSAGNLQNAFGDNLDTAAGSKGAGFDTNIEIADYIGEIIQIALSFIGVIFLALAIYGGYIWMIARGNEQEVKKAKDIITAAIIGLVIVVAAYAISWLIISKLGGAALQGSNPET